MAGSRRMEVHPFVPCSHAREMRKPALLLRGIFRAETFGFQLSSHKQPPPHSSGGLCYDKHHGWAVTVTGSIPDKLPCVLRGGFIRKNFRINPLQGGFVGKFAFYRHLSRKKVRLNRCSAAEGAIRKMRSKLWRLLDSSAPNCCPVV